MAARERSEWERETRVATWRSGTRSAEVRGVRVEKSRTRTKRRRWGRGARRRRMALATVIEGGRWRSNDLLYVIITLAMRRGFTRGWGWPVGCWRREIRALSMRLLAAMRTGREAGWRIKWRRRRAQQRTIEIGIDGRSRFARGRTRCRQTIA
jgi:hypothetical protein